MKSTFKRLLSGLLALCVALSLAACGPQDDQPEVAEDIVNGDFEEVSDNKWVGWTREDETSNTSRTPALRPAISPAGRFWRAPP